MGGIDLRAGASSAVPICRDQATLKAYLDLVRQDTARV